MRATFSSYTRIMNENDIKKFGLRKVVIPSALGSDNAGDLFAPKNGAYKSALVEYEQNKNQYIYTCDGVYTRVQDITADFLGCENYTEAEYLENIMSEDILSLTYKGELQWV